MLLTQQGQQNRHSWLVVNMPSIPTVPYYHLTPVMRPMDLEKAQHSVFVDFHAIGFNHGMHIGRFNPVFQLLLCVPVSYDNNKQGFCGPVTGYGHLMQSHTFGCSNRQIS